jgi:chromosome segregation ATPase
MDISQLQELAQENKDLTVSIETLTKKLNEAIEARNAFGKEIEELKDMKKYWEKSYNNCISSLQSAQSVIKELKDELRRAKIDLSAARLNSNSRVFTGVLKEVEKEISRATVKFPPYNSAHEGYAVIKEELDELWEHVRTRDENRNVEEMAQEAIQVATTAVRFVIDVCKKQLPEQAEDEA